MWAHESKSRFGTGLLCCNIIKQSECLPLFLACLDTDDNQHSCIWIPAQSVHGCHFPLTCVCVWWTQQRTAAPHGKMKTNKEQEFTVFVITWASTDAKIRSHWHKDNVRMKTLVESFATKTAAWLWMAVHEQCAWMRWEAMEFTF